MSIGIEPGTGIGVQRGTTLFRRVRGERPPRQSWSGLLGRGGAVSRRQDCYRDQARFLKRQLSLPVSTMSQ